ncbi:hypothetical protein ACI2KT_27580 [Ensifer adhaerens]|uniref:hypothetical protein n=1 Tax=Ensifer adhaerens TaxID=106592 RepID=UPI00384AF399
MTVNNIKELLTRLQGATQPDSDLDLEIANAINWFERANKVIDIAGGRPQVPQFTNYLDHALKLARVIEPNHVGAFIWDNGIYEAALDYNQPCGGANPAIALCIAALKAKLSQEE